MTMRKRKKQHASKQQHLWRSMCGWMDVRVCKLFESKRKKMNNQLNLWQSRTPSKPPRTLFRWNDLVYRNGVSRGNQNLHKVSNLFRPERESELCLSITWCLLFWILGKNKFHAKERTLKRTRRIVDTFTSKQTNKRRNRVPVIGCIRHEQVLGEWSVWHWPLSQHHFYINNINNNNNSNHIQRSYDEKHN